MGKHSSSKANKKPGKKDSPLRKSFDKNKKKDEVNGPTRQENSLFLTYLKSAMKGNNETSQAQATALHTYYARLSIQEKKGVISEFFRQGGKKQGLQSIFSQYVECENLAEDGKWSGYANWRKVLKLKEVPWPNKTITHHQHNLVW